MQLPYNLDEFQPNTIATAKTLFPPKYQRGPGEWVPFVLLIVDLIKELAGSCNLNPSQATSEINKRYWRIFDPFGYRQQRHDDLIRLVVAQHWKGALGDFKTVCEQVMDAIKGGKVTDEMVRDLYAENVR